MLARALHFDEQPSLPPLQLRGPFCGRNETLKASSESVARDENPNTRTNYLIAKKNLTMPYHRDALKDGPEVG